MLIKILFILFFLSGLNLLRQSYFFIQSWVKGERFVLGRLELISVGLSISYILTMIITGFGG